MQLSIMNKVKSGELSIEDALNQAKKDRKQLLRRMSQAEEVPAFKSFLNISWAVILKCSCRPGFEYGIVFFFVLGEMGNLLCR